MLDEAPGLPEARTLLARATMLAASADDAEARQAASALYHLTTAIAMAWEAAHTDDPSRLALARMVLCHRVMPRDPLDPADPDADGLGSLLYKPTIE